MKYGNYISKETCALTQKEIESILDILKDAINPYTVKFGVKFMGVSQGDYYTNFTFSIKEMNGRNSDGSRIRSCDGFSVNIHKSKGVLEDRSECPGGRWDPEHIKYTPTPFDYHYCSSMYCKGGICEHGHRTWYKIAPKDNYQWGTEFSDLNLDTLIHSFFKMVAIVPDKKRLPSSVSKGFARLINSVAKKLNFKVYAEYVEMPASQYRYLVDYDLFRAEENKDLMWETDTCKAIRLSYPPEYFAMDHYLTTAEIKSNLLGATTQEAIDNAIYAMCAI